MPEFIDLPRHWAAAPIGRESEWWHTVPFERTILVVARGPTTMLWVFDFLEELLADPRIQIVFTVDEDTPDTFSRGFADIASIADAVAIPWSHALAGSFDLAITASRKGGLHRLRCPLLLGPHGASIGKHDPVAFAEPFPVPEIEKPSGPNAATTVMIAHPADRELLAPDQSGVDVVVTGDPCLDRLRASEPLRELYRSDLGLEPTQRLVVVSSTWGPDALMAAVPDIGTRLASELPVDRYRIALIVHPNTWTAHGIWQVHTWTRRSTSAGVLAIPPWRNAWRSALMASDIVIHDHGSVGLYAAALRKPLMVGRFDSDLTIDGSPIARLARLAPLLNLDAPLQPQIDAAIAGHVPRRYDSIAGRLSSEPGESLRLHRDLIYDLIALDPPLTEPRLLALARPPDPLPAIYSHHVRTRVADCATVAVERFPAVTPPPPPQHAGGGGQHHLVSDVCEPDTRIPPNAAILFDSARTHTPMQLLQRYPGCRYAIAGCDGPDITIWHSHGHRLRLRPSSPPTGFEPLVLASACYALETAGHDIGADDDCTVTLGGRSLRFSTEPLG